MSNIESKDISVVVQGAIDKKITCKCLKSIRKYLPGAEIILSTWEDSDVAGLDYDILLENKDPGGMQLRFYIYNLNYPNNFNRQLVSTKNGILKASRKYCLKMRSDLVLKNAHFLNYWDKFSAQNEQYKIFKHRVLCSSVYSREYFHRNDTIGLPTPFCVSDFWFFGFIEDIKDYFLDCPLQTIEEGSNWEFKYPSRCPATPSRRLPPEQFFCANWVKKYYPDLQFYDWSDWNAENIEFANNILYNNFIFLGLEESGVYSKKHSFGEKNKHNMQGIITYQHFKKQYKNYCDGTYKSDDYKYKLSKHFNNFMQPVYRLNHWIGEFLSVLYYLFALIFEKIARGVGKII